MFLIFIYLFAIVLANLVISKFGADASVITAFVFIGLNITSRDYLHDMWKENLKRNMFLLILTGSVLSFALNAGQIAVASFFAFLVSESVDALVYQKLSKYDRFIKINGSNVFSSLLDSFIFLVLAFGYPPLWGIVIKQFLAKIVGGFLWSYLLRSVKWK